MSDSDETNLLLLIPPDFFMVNPTNGDQSPETDEDGAGSSVSSKMYRNYKPTTAGLGRCHQNTDPNHRIASGADQSFRSGSLYREDMWSSDKKFVHSTPKVSDSMLSNGFGAARNGDGGNRGSDSVIKEIDSFLKTKGKSSEGYSFMAQQRNSLEAAEDILHAFRNKCSVEDGRPSLGYTSVQRKLLKEDEPLMSLSSIWSREDKVGSNNTATVQEERMRRQHCEQTIQGLQQMALEYEQKIAVAIQVDRRKDEVLASTKHSNQKLSNKVDSLEHTLLQTDQRFAAAQQKYEDEIARLKRSNDTMQTELNRTLVSNRHLNECNELLEQKIAHITRSTSEVRNGHQQQISEMDVRLSNAAKSEEILTAEMTKWKSVAVKLKTEITNNTELESLKIKVKELEDKLGSEKALAERDLQQYRNKVDSMQVKEKTLILELETQRVSLKSFYQTQLDESVAQKVAEFQQQLDSVEATLRDEGKQRERTIAERAIRQMELINQKNEQEFTLISEKHNEECDLYRMQLTQAKQIVAELSRKVEEFHTKRSDIAERLHTVMETQWQRALEILASPTTPEQKPVLNCQKTKPENETFQTPTTSRCNSQTAGGTEGAKNDRLNHYIELLLEKSPRDLDQLNAILQSPSDRSQSNPQHRLSNNDVSFAASGRRHAKHQSSQQPWK